MSLLQSETTLRDYFDGPDFDGRELLAVLNPPTLQRPQNY